MRTLHLFAGAGGGLLADLILGHTPVAAVEWDRYCCQVLRERAAEGWFPGLHVYEGDVRLFDPSEYAGRVDCIAAGFPCQDISSAGNRAGIAEGTRSGLWSEVVRVARIVRPRYLFLENVAAIVGLGLDTVLADLAAMGFDARWCCLRASDIGAPHQRDRWWCVAYTARLLGDGGDDDPGVGLGTESLSELGNGSGSAVVADTDHERCRNESERCPAVAIARRIRAEVTNSNFGRWTVEPDLGRVANELAPSMDSAQGEIDDTERNPQASTTGDIGSGPELQQVWLNGTATPSDGAAFSWWQVEPDVGRVANGIPKRVDRLKALGNGQVPAQAALAWRILTD